MKKIQLNGHRFKASPIKGYALVDDEDFELVNKIKWSWNNGYASYKSTWVRETILMHRVIMNAQKEQMIDHINGNTIDNRRCNLRFCTDSQNQMNRGKSPKKSSSIYKGVHLEKYTKKWVSNIVIKKKLYYIGTFDSERHAAMAYDIAAKDLHGEFARFNFKSIN